LPAERLQYFGEIKQGNPRIEVLSDAFRWFRVPEGTTTISVEQQQFTVDGSAYFRAPVTFAPMIMALRGLAGSAASRRRRNDDP
jgi:hypothetical protein